MTNTRSLKGSLKSCASLRGRVEAVEGDKSHDSGTTCSAVQVSTYFWPCILFPFSFKYVFFSLCSPFYFFLFFCISHLLLSTLLQFFPCLLHPNASPPGWLTVCCVYLGLQGDVGLPGPSGTPGDGSLRSEQTLTIYKGDKVTQQGKARSR